MTDTLNTIPCVWLPLLEKNIILPTSAIAEILPFEKPKLLPDMPHWLLGILSWRDIQIPFVDLEKMKLETAWNEYNDNQLENIGASYRIAILNRIAKVSEKDETGIFHAKYPFFAILLKRNPKIYKISSEDIYVVSEIPDKSRFLFELKINNEPVWVPNLPSLWDIIDKLPTRMQWLGRVFF